MLFYFVSVCLVFVRMAKIRSALTEQYESAIKETSAQIAQRKVPCFYLFFFFCLYMFSAQFFFSDLGCRSGSTRFEGSRESLFVFYKKN